MDSDLLVTNCLTGEFGENQIISVVDHVHHSTTKSDSFVVDMERFSHLIEKEKVTNSTHSRITRNLSRKGSMKPAERKVSSNERDASMIATSPRATFTLEKQALVVAGPQDHSLATPQLHHQISITNGCITTASAQTKAGPTKRFGFRRSSTIDPTRILFFFATISCMGTILLIYFTLSMGKINGDANNDNPLN
ncbi:uncharacterized protein LOC121741332 isoform X2 [Salvia splendens]|uniref:uncharacterized protein LOC121741332 isoform X2 n=1 Tax=Salvia splendens TaxID=180675 RepID=UPI001104A3EC|nr:uncharacterized protein LOC121741332 isoform X2 [Salvia splendens]